MDRQGRPITITGRDRFHIIYMYTLALTTLGAVLSFTYFRRSGKMKLPALGELSMEEDEKKLSNSWLFRPISTWPIFKEWADDARASSTQAHPVNYGPPRPAPPATPAPSNNKPSTSQ